MLIAVKVEKGLVKIYHWQEGGCATLNSSGWLGWATPNESSHPAQSENEFVHKCLTNPGDYFIQANENGLLITPNEEKK